MKIYFQDWSNDPANHSFTMRDTVSCKVTFVAEEDQEWVALGLEEAVSVTGSLSPETYVLHTHIFSGNTSMKAGEQRTYGFETTLVRAVGYQGKNGSAQAQLIAFARPLPQPVGFFGRLMGKDGWIRSKVNVMVNEAPGFTINGEPEALKAKNSNIFMGLAFFLCISFAFVAFFLAEFRVPTLVASAMYLAVYLYRKWIIRSLGEISLVTEPLGEDGFLAKITTSEFGARFRKLEAWYAVVERVVDHRGTSSSTYTHELHVSPKDERQGDGTVYRFEHRFADCPPYRNYGDLKILWEYNVRIEAHLGLVFTYQGSLQVERG